MLFPKEDMRKICKGENPDERYEVVEQGNWIAEYKWERRETIFLYEHRHYRITEGRTASYYTEYHYYSDEWPEEVEAFEVESVPVMKYEWRLVSPPHIKRQNTH